MWLHPKTESLPTDMLGPFVRLPDGAVLAVEGNTVCRSENEGATWDKWPLFEEAVKFTVSNERARWRRWGIFSAPMPIR